MLACHSDGLCNKAWGNSVHGVGCLAFLRKNNLSLRCSTRVVRDWYASGLPIAQTLSNNLSYVLLVSCMYYGRSCWNYVVEMCIIALLCYILRARETPHISTYLRLHIRGSTLSVKQHACILMYVSKYFSSLKRARFLEIIYFMKAVRISGISSMVDTVKENSVFRVGGLLSES